MYLKVPVPVIVCQNREIIWVAHLTVTGEKDHKALTEMGSTTAEIQATEHLEAIELMVMVGKESQIIVTIRIMNYLTKVLEIMNPEIEIMIQVTKIMNLFVTMTWETTVKILIIRILITVEAIILVVVMIKKHNLSQMANQEPKTLMHGHFITVQYLKIVKM